MRFIISQTISKFHYGMCQNPIETLLGLMVAWGQRLLVLLNNIPSLECVAKSWQEKKKVSMGQKRDQRRKITVPKEWNEDAFDSIDTPNVPNLLAVAVLVAAADHHCLVYIFLPFYIADIQWMRWVRRKSREIRQRESDLKFCESSNRKKHSFPLFSNHANTLASNLFAKRAFPRCFHQMVFSIYIERGIDSTLDPE